DRTRKDCEAQKKAAAEAAAIFAKNKDPEPLLQHGLPKTKAQEAFSAPPNGLLRPVFSFH
ncbi:MAG: hypothetical protein OIF58_11980, partial [Cohaesibacter sp.]|nr:hypothetical protein [Cohaesibacter sp.]